MRLYWLQATPVARCRSAPAQGSPEWTFKSATQSNWSTNRMPARGSTTMENKTLNQKTLMVLAPLLVLTGIAGFVIPEQYSLMGGAAPYNTFHLIFGIVGLLLISTRNDLVASSFNLGFGLIDLYQVLA